METSVLNLLFELKITLPSRVMKRSEEDAAAHHHFQSNGLVCFTRKLSPPNYSMCDRKLLVSLVMNYFQWCVGAGTKGTWFHSQNVPSPFFFFPCQDAVSSVGELNPGQPSLWVRKSERQTEERGETGAGGKLKPCKFPVFLLLCSRRNRELNKLNLFFFVSRRLFLSVH